MKNNLENLFELSNEELEQVSGGADLSAEQLSMYSKVASCDTKDSAMLH